VDPMMDEAEDEQPDSLSQQDADQEAPSGDGYQLVLKVTPAGLSVCKKPLTEPSPGDGFNRTEEPPYDEIDVENINQALKAILLLYKQNPVGATEEAAMQAEYGKGGA